MKRQLSDWYIPRDWLFILSWCFIFLPVAILSGMFLPALSDARRGDPALFFVSLALAIVGIVLLFFARLPLYRQRRFFTFGPRALPASHRRLYWTAYGFIGAAVAILLLLFLVLR